MKYHYQKYSHDPENGVYGDCFRTTLACIMDLEIEEVPHFFNCPKRNKEERWDDIWDEIREWLRMTHNCTLFLVPYSASSLEKLLASIKIINPGIPYLLSGESSRGVDHQVIACDDKIIWDPVLGEDGDLIGPCGDGFFWINLIVRNQGV